MALDHLRVLRLAQDLEEVVVPDKVEAWEGRTLLLKEVGEGLLADLELRQHLGQRVNDARHVCQMDQEGIPLNTAHELFELVVDSAEPGLLVGQGTAGKYGLEVHPLPLNDVEIHQALREHRQAVLPSRGLNLERGVKGRVLERLHEALVVRDIRHGLLPLLDQRQVLGAISELVAQQREFPVEAPGLELLKGLTDGDLALGLRVECLDLVRLGEEAVCLVEEVPKIEIVKRHSVSPLRGEGHEGE